MSQNSSDFSESLDSQRNPVKPEEKSVFWLQTRLLMWKQYLVFTRNLKSTLFQVFTPVFICIFLVLLQQLANYSMSTMVIKTPSVLESTKIPKCYGSDCITLGIAYTNPNTTLVSQYILQYLMAHEDLSMGKDMKVIADNYNDTINFLAKYPNKTQTAVLICTGPFKLPDNPYYNGTFDCLNSIPEIKTTIYSLLINSTITPMTYFSGFNSPQPVDYASLAVKRAIDSALVSYYSKGLNNSISTYVQNYPAPTNRWMQGYDIVTASGAFYFFIPPMVTFVVLLIEIVREKEYRLRFGLSMMGMTSGPYWLSWFATGIIFIFIVTNSLIISGLACVFDVFLHTPYPILIMIFGLFSIAMMNLAFLIAITLKTTKSAYTISYAFILAGLVLQFLMSDITIIYMIYGDDVKNWVKVARIFLSLYPPFNFSKAFGDIALKASAHYSSREKRWVPGDDYTWSDFVSTIHAKSQGNTSTVPSTAVTVLTLLGNALMIGAIAWYLDHVLESNRGTPDPYYFFFSPKYWGCKKKSQKSQKSTIIPDLVKNFKIQESSLLTDSMLGPENGISIKGLGKVFKAKTFCKSKSDIHAVNSFSLEINNKELLAVLGHNGAGKSTLINILTGLTSCSYGTAKVFGFDINEEMGEIRKILGVCPQHDILWNELTAKEHLILFSMLKHVPYEKALTEAEEKLIQVKLIHVQNRYVGTFSGGMKRRLSVAISGVGNPKIIILDEPTTGMDPINRRSAWKLIRDMKKDRVLILTTHSMEEADVLSDRVCVVVDGKLSCLGTALYLKNNYGDGFRITLVSKYPHELCVEIHKSFPSAKVLDSSGGSVVISIPLCHTEEIQAFVKEMEGQTRLRTLVEDWGLSNTTLEEVFMRVTGKKDKKPDEI